MKEYIKKEKNERKKSIMNCLFLNLMIKGENLINQVKKDSMKIGGEYKMFDMNYISSIF